MAYNFPTGYPSFPYSQGVSVPNFASQALQGINNPFIWVQGENGAKSYMVAANSRVPLWDSEAQKIYIKSADASGMPSITTLEYTIVGGELKTSDELSALKAQVETLRADLNKLMEAKDEPTVQHA